MSELEPTITELEPTATERLRALLDERGVEYETYIEQPTGFEHVKWNFNEHGSADFNLEFGEPWLTMYGTISGPEQAIAATLGSCNCSNNERTSDSDATAERRGDAVEVVRCRDCACFSVDDSDHDYRTGGWCKRWYTDMVMPDGFCAWASRKESE